MSKRFPNGFAGISHLVTDIDARMHEIKISVQMREDQAQPKSRETVTALTRLAEIVRLQGQAHPKSRETATAPKNDRKTRNVQRQTNASVGETLKVYMWLILGLVVIGFVLDSC